MSDAAELACLLEDDDSVCDLLALDGELEGISAGAVEEVMEGDEAGRGDVVLRTKSDGQAVQLASMGADNVRALSISCIRQCRVPRGGLPAHTRARAGANCRTEAL